MCRSSDIRSFKKAMLLICEGTKTEPNFFSAFRDDKNKCKVEGEIIIQPKPSLALEDIDVQLKRGNFVRQKRALKSVEEDDLPMVFPGPQPLNWVKTGINGLDTFEEVWCIFDRDEHPKRREAFELVDSQRQAGKNIYIAFSSRCIEFYFLLHFEYLYKAFEKSECHEKINGKTRYFRCCLPDEVIGKACQGERCVNGYARMKGYWTESKSDLSLYPFIKEHLLFAIRNAELIRRESSLHYNPAIPFYDRNPYVTVDRLIARLLGYAILGSNHPISTKAGSTVLRISIISDRVVIENIGVISFAIQKDFVQKLDYITEAVLDSVCEPIILQPEKQCEIALEGQEGDLYRINLLHQPCLFVL